MKISATMLLILCIAAGSAHATAVWDGLPALEPLHLQGPNAGSRICPMCRYGYDAGIMVFVPKSISVETARALVRNLAPVALGMSSERFRVFILVTGEPSSQQLKALALDDPRWFVASLSGSALDKAEREIEQVVRNRTWGYVFAQRRLLRLLADEQLYGASVGELKAQSRYAMELLTTLFPTPGVFPNADVPKSAPWFAPAKLGSRIELRTAIASGTRKMCFVSETGSSLSNALADVAVPKSNDATSWARTDASGCVDVSGSSNDSLAITLYTNLNPARHAVIDASQFNRPRSQVVASTVTGKVGNVGGASSKPERVVGLPCENCDNVFQERPEIISSQSRIAPVEEPGEPLQLQGRVLNSRGLPVTGVIVFAYQTNQEGVYPTVVVASGARRMRLRSWVRTDQQGYYLFETIRPGGYPGRPDPAHIHMHVIEPGRCTYYIGDVFFTDDPRVRLQSTSTHERGGSGLTTPFKDRGGAWQATRDIKLGLNVPGYEHCKER